MLLREIIDPNEKREIHKFRKKPRRLAGHLRRKADEQGNAEVKGMRDLGVDGLKEAQLFRTLDLPKEIRPFEKELDEIWQHLKFEVELHGINGFDCYEAASDSNEYWKIPHHEILDEVIERMCNTLYDQAD